MDLIQAKQELVTAATCGLKERSRSNFTPKFLTLEADDGGGGKEVGQHEVNPSVGEEPESSISVFSKLHCKLLVVIQFITVSRQAFNESIDPAA